MKFQPHKKLNAKKDIDIFAFKLSDIVFYHDNKCKNANHFNIYEHDEFHSQLS